MESFISATGLPMIELLKFVPWIVGGIVLIGGVWLNKNLHWPIFAAVFAFMLSNLAIASCILVTYDAEIWGFNDQNQIVAPELPDGPLIGQVTNPLNEFTSGFANTANDLVTIKNAFMEAQDFFVMFLVALPIMIVSLVVAYLISKRVRALIRKCTDEDLNALYNEVNRARAARGEKLLVRKRMPYSVQLPKFLRR